MNNPERHHVLLTTLGTDRPGIVEEIAGWVLRQGGNIQDSRMSVLGGEFATIILVSGDASLAGRIDGSRGEFEQQSGLTVFTKPVSPKPAAPAETVLRYALTATSLDHAGIVHRITAFLRGKGINIVSASTHTTSAPFSGAPVFHFQAAIDLPASLPLSRVRRELQELGDRENIDFVLKAVE